MPRPPGTRSTFRLPWPTRARIDDEIDEELRFHIEAVAAELRATGWSAFEADAEARRRFGDIDYTRHYCRAEDARRERETNRMAILEELLQDLRYAFRSLRASPGFALTALFTLALGIGANTAIFSVVRAVLLEPLPFTAPDRIVRVWHANPVSGPPRGAVSEPDFLDWRAESRVAESMGGWLFMEGMTGLDMTGSGAPERISAALVTDGFFETLGTGAALGRVTRREEHVAGNDRVVVLSHALWSRRFASDPAIVGRGITLDGDAFTVVGVMPPAFTYPGDRTLDLWIPVSVFGPDDIGRSRGAHFLSVVARLRPGASPEQLRREISGIAARLARDNPENPGWTDAAVLPIRESIVGEVRTPLLVLVGAVALVLLIACVNIASLLLARASARERELAVRSALGAGRGRIVRQLLTESTALALIGGALGVGLAYIAVRALASAGSADLPGAAAVRIDALVLGFTLLASILCGVAFGLIPALRSATPELDQALRAGSRGSIGRRGQRLRSGLVVLEMALAVILVAGAGLATKSFARLVSVDPGFEPSNALVTTMSIPGHYFDRQQGMVHYQRVLEAVRAVPGVQAAGSIRDLPTQGRGEMIRAQIVGGAPVRPGEEPAAQLHHVSADYFAAMGIRMLAGRDFTLSDNAEAPPVLVVNEAAAKRFWPGQSAVGKSVRLGAAELRIVGVVGDVRQNGLAEDVEPAAYIHAMQNMRARMNIVIRTSGDPTRLARAVRQAIWSVDPNQTITSVASLESVLGEDVARPRLLAWLLGLFGIVGLTLGALGIHGVLAYAVTQRRREIGLRVALGAQPGSVLRMVVGYGLALALLGVTIGIVGVVGLGEVARGVWYGIGSTDAATLAQVALVLVGAALAASWIPARRALAVDPVEALRGE